MAAGNYTVTATAQDDHGSSKTSTGIMVKVSKTLKGVRGGKNATNTITSAFTQLQPSLATDAGQSAAMESLVAELEQTYSDFLDEKAMFPSSSVIEKYLFASTFLAKSGLALSTQQALGSAVIDRVKKINSYLSFSEDLMVDGVISASTITAGDRNKAQRNISIGLPDANPFGQAGVNLLGNQMARISTSASNPFSTQTDTASGGGSFEVADVSVTVGGVAALVLSVSPTELTVIVPSNLAGGVAEVLVSSREGFLQYGTANVAGLNPVIIGAADDSNGRAAVVDSFGSRFGTFQTGGGLSIGLDGRTRLSILATGLSSGLVNVDQTNDVWLNSGQRLENLADVVSVQARTSDGRVFNLPVEYAGAQGTRRGIDQVNVVLVPELAGAGTVQLTITAAGVTSSAKTISIN